MTDPAALVSDQVDQLLAKADPASTDPVEFRGLQYDLGLAWVHFPEGFGGLGLAPTLQRDVDNRLRAAGAKSPDAREFFGLTMAGPTVVTHGSDEMRNTWLRRMFSGEDAWCQLFSEPGAGSDLADRGMLVARTDPNAPKHKGLTYFGVDMHAPGVEVRPLRQMTGEAEFNEVYFTEVRVPDRDRIGDVGEGWRVAMTTLMNERTTIGGASGPPTRGSGSIAEAVRIWRDEVADHDAATRDRLTQAWIRAEVLRLTNIRAAQNRKAGNPGPEGSIAKLMFAEVNKDVYDLCIDLLGPDGMVGYDYTNRRTEQLGLIGAPGSSRKMFLRARANSIEGGTSEIQRNIIGERVLGLPGEPRTDKDQPWKDVPRN
jgi:alkylation response protein AidB-like acyl-CoA dehydrogenase